MTLESWDTVATKVDFNLEINLDDFKKWVTPEAPILDYGCGYGRVCNRLHALGYKNITGCDTSLEMINRGNNNFPYLPLFQNTDIRLEYPDHTYTAVILCAVLTCVLDNKEKVEIISEAYRLLKQDGLLHVVEFCSPTGKIFESGFGIMMSYQRPEELRKMLMNCTQELSFKVNQVETMSGSKTEAISYFGKKRCNEYP